MPNELTDLLPFSRRQTLTREYHLRLGVVALILFSALVLTAAVLLLPTYVFLVKSAYVKAEHLANITSALSSSDETALSARLSSLSSDAAALISLSKKPAVSKIMRSVLSVPRAGITLSGFVYTPVTGKGSNVLALSGVAATRDALRGYQLMLQGTQGIVSAEVPVSAYAKDANILFTITLTLAP
ncbi:MAG: hypothetical protein AAB709_00895 [Patescibacteria group bacterium]